MMLDEACIDAPPLERADRVYKNDGNAPLVDLLDFRVQRLLDVGCGAGDNARLVKARFPHCEVYGVTHSATEAAIAKVSMTDCWVWDIEGRIPEHVECQRFDAMIFSHVLEHLRDPGSVVRKFSHLIRGGGTVLIAVPNTLSWAMRWQFLRGDFEYQSSGVLDDTHLRFFTYLTADKYLLAKCPELKLLSKSVTGSVPLWLLRRYVLPRAWCQAIDEWGCRRWPNLFGGEILIKATLERADGQT